MQISQKRKISSPFFVFFVFLFFLHAARLDFILNILKKKLTLIADVI